MTSLQCVEAFFPTTVCFEGERNREGHGPQNRQYNNWDEVVKRGYANQTLFVKNDENYLLMAQVYVDDIVFGAIIDARAIEFSKKMKKEFEMSMMGELTFFLGL